MGNGCSKCCKCNDHKNYHGTLSAASSIYRKRSRGEIPIYNSDRFRITKTSNAVQLAVERVQREDAGHYTLFAKTKANDVIRKDVELIVDDRSTGDDPPIFFRRLVDLQVRVGSSTRLIVEIRSSTDVKLTWFRNDRRICENDRIKQVHEGTFYYLEISPVILEDGGQWMVMAENLSGRDSCISNLSVIVPKAYKAPEFIEELRAILTQQGTVSLECKVVGVPTPQLRWFKDSKEIKAGDVFALTANADDPTSLGTYTCEAVNCVGKSYSSSKLHVVGRGSREGSLKPADGVTNTAPPPIFSNELKNASVRIGETIILGCQVAVPPWPQSVVWYNKNGRVDSSDRYKYIEDGLGVYMIEVKPSEACDEGEWKCVVTNEEGCVGISSCTVDMEIPKNYRKPRFMESLRAILTEEGLVSFECKVVGFPTPQLKWFKDGQELKPGDVYQLTGTNSLGTYCCVAKNCMGETSSVAVLTVEDIQNQLNDEERLTFAATTSQPPKFVLGLKSIEAKINEPFQFTVKVEATPDPLLSWFRDELPIECNERYNQYRGEEDNWHLDVRCLEFIDQAEWKCVAVNDFGTTVTSCFLKLQIPRHYKKPRFLECLKAVLTEEGAVNLECKVIGVPQPVLKWYKDGVELKPGDIHKIISGQDGTCCLGTYTCEARNCMGIVASSAALLGFEDDYSKQETQQQRELQRNFSLSTIQEEHTSQLYETPQGDITVTDRGDVSFSFDGKEVSVSLYETPDLTEEEALKIVEMYADQISEHVTEHNVVELPPLRFVKETSQSGKLLMEAVVIDISPDYFSHEEDLRTEAGMDDISINEVTIHGSSIKEEEEVFDKQTEEFAKDSFEKMEEELSLTATVRKRKKSKPTEADEFFSLSKASDASVEENTSDLQTFASAQMSKKDSLDNQSLTESIQAPARKKGKKTDSESLKTTENEAQLQDISGAAGDGLKVTSDKPVKIVTNEADIEKNLKALLPLAKLLKILDGHLNAVESEVINQSVMLMTPASADQSIRIIKNVIEPLIQIQSKLKVYSGETPLDVLFETMKDDIRNLHIALQVIEKCVEIDETGTTLIQRTSVCIIDSTADYLIQTLNEVRNISQSFENESLKSHLELTVDDIKQGLEITKGTIKSQALLQEAQELEATKHFTETVAKLQDIPEPLPFAKIADVNLPQYAESVKLIFQPVLEIQQSLEKVENELTLEETDEEIYKKVHKKIMLNLVEPISKLQVIAKQIESKVASLTGTDCVEQKINMAILDIVSPPLFELNKGLEIIQQQPSDNIEAGKITVSTVESMVPPLQEIQNGLAQLSQDIISGQMTDEQFMDTDDLKKLLQSLAQAVLHLETNIDHIISRLPENVSTNFSKLTEEISSLISQVIDKSIDKYHFNVLENIKRPIDELNYCIRQIEQKGISGSLTDLIDPLHSLNDRVKMNQDILQLSTASQNTDVRETLEKISNLIKTIEIGIEENELKNIQNEIYLDEEQALKDDNLFISMRQGMEMKIELEESIKTIQKLCSHLENLENSEFFDNKLKNYLSDMTKNFDEISKKLKNNQGVDQDSESLSVLLDVLRNPSKVLANLNTSLEYLSSIKTKVDFSKTLYTKCHSEFEELKSSIDQMDFEGLKTSTKSYDPIIESFNNILVVLENLMPKLLAEVSAEDMSTCEEVSALKSAVESLPLDNNSQAISGPLRSFEEKKVQVEELLGQLKNSIASVLAHCNDYDMGLLRLETAEHMNATVEKMEDLKQCLEQTLQPHVLDVVHTNSECTDPRTMAEAVCSLENCALQIQEYIENYDVKDLSGDEISELKTIAQPLKELVEGIKIFYTQDLEQVETMQSLSQDSLTSAKILQSLRPYVLAVQEHQALETLESIADLQTFSHLKEIMQPLKELEKALVCTEENILLSQISNLTEPTNVESLKTWAKPLLAIKEALINIKQEQLCGSLEECPQLKIVKEKSKVLFDLLKYCENFDTQVFENIEDISTYEICQIKLHAELATVSETKLMEPAIKHLEEVKIFDLKECVAGGIKQIDECLHTTKNLQTLKGSSIEDIMQELKSDLQDMESNLLKSGEKTKDLEEKENKVAKTMFKLKECLVHTYEATDIEVGLEDIEKTFEDLLQAMPSLELQLALEMKEKIVLALSEFIVVCLQSQSQPQFDNLIQPFRNLMETVDVISKLKKTDVETSASIMVQLQTQVMAAFRVLNDVSEKAPDKMLPTLLKTQNILVSIYDFIENNEGNLRVIELLQEIDYLTPELKEMTTLLMLEKENSSERVKEIQILLENVNAAQLFLTEIHEGLLQNNALVQIFMEQNDGPVEKLKNVLVEVERKLQTKEAYALEKGVVFNTLAGLLNELKANMENVKQMDLGKHVQEKIDRHDKAVESEMDVDAVPLQQAKCDKLEKLSGKEADILHLLEESRQNIEELLTETNLKESTYEFVKSALTNLKELHAAIESSTPNTHEDRLFLPIFKTKELLNQAIQCDQRTDRNFMKTFKNLNHVFIQIFNNNDKLRKSILYDTLEAIKPELKQIEDCVKNMTQNKSHILQSLVSTCNHIDSEINTIYQTNLTNLGPSSQVFEKLQSSILQLKEITDSIQKIKTNAVNSKKLTQLAERLNMNEITDALEILQELENMQEMFKDLHKVVSTEPKLQQKSLEETVESALEKIADSSDVQNLKEDLKNSLEAKSNEQKRNCIFKLREHIVHTYEGAINENIENVIDSILGNNNDLIESINNDFIGYIEKSVSTLVGKITEVKSEPWQLKRSGVNRKLTNIQQVAQNLKSFKEVEKSSVHMIELQKCLMDLFVQFNDMLDANSSVIESDIDMVKSFVLQQHDFIEKSEVNIKSLNVYQSILDLCKSIETVVDKIILDSEHQIESVTEVKRPEPSKVTAEKIQANELNVEMKKAKERNLEAPSLSKATVSELETEKVEELQMAVDSHKLQDREVKEVNLAKRKAEISEVKAEILEEKLLETECKKSKEEAIQKTKEQPKVVTEVKVEKIEKLQLETEAQKTQEKDIERKQGKAKVTEVKSEKTTQKQQEDSEGKAKDSEVKPKIIAEKKLEVVSQEIKEGDIKAANAKAKVETSQVGLEEIEEKTSEVKTLKAKEEIIEKTAESAELTKVKAEEIQEMRLGTEAKKTEDHKLEEQSEEPKQSEIKAEKIEEKKFTVDSKKAEEQEVNIFKDKAEVSEVKAQKLEQKQVEAESKGIKKESLKKSTGKAEITQVEPEKLYVEQTQDNTKVSELKREEIVELENDTKKPKDKDIDETAKGEVKISVVKEEMETKMQVLQKAVANTLAKIGDSKELQKLKEDIEEAMKSASDEQKRKCIFKLKEHIVHTYDDSLIKDEIEEVIDSILGNNTDLIQSINAELLSEVDEKINLLIVKNQIVDTPKWRDKFSKLNITLKNIQKVGKELESVKEVEKASHSMTELKKNLMNIFVLFDDMLEIKAPNLNSDLENVKILALEHHDLIENSDKNIKILNLYRNITNLCETMAEVVDKVVKLSETEDRKAEEAVEIEFEFETKKINKAVIKEKTEKAKVSVTMAETIEEKQVVDNYKKVEEKHVEFSKDKAKVSEVKAEKLEEKQLEVKILNTKHEILEESKDKTETSQVKAEKIEQISLNIEPKKAEETKLETLPNKAKISKVKTEKVLEEQLESNSKKLKEEDIKISKGVAEISEIKLGRIEEEKIEAEAKKAEEKSAEKTEEKAEVSKVKAEKLEVKQMEIDSKKLNEEEVQQLTGTAEISEIELEKIEENKIETEPKKAKKESAKKTEEKVAVSEVKAEKLEVKEIEIDPKKLKKEEVTQPTEAAEIKLEKIEEKNVETEPKKAKEETVKKLEQKAKVSGITAEKVEENRMEVDSKKFIEEKIKQPKGKAEISEVKAQKIEEKKLDIESKKAQEVAAKKLEEKANSSVAKAEKIVENKIETEPKKAKEESAKKTEEKAVVSEVKAEKLEVKGLEIDSKKLKKEEVTQPTEAAEISEIKLEKIEEKKVETEPKKAKEETVKKLEQKAKVSDITAEKVEENRMEVDSKKFKEEEMKQPKGTAEISEVKPQKIEEKKLDVESKKAQEVAANKLEEKANSSVAKAEKIEKNKIETEPKKAKEESTKKTEEKAEVTEIIADKLEVKGIEIDSKKLKKEEVTQLTEAAEISEIKLEKIEEKNVETEPKKAKEETVKKLEQKAKVSGITAEKVEENRMEVESKKFKEEEMKQPKGTAEISEVKPQKIEEKILDVESKKAQEVAAKKLEEKANSSVAKAEKIVENKIETEPKKAKEESAKKTEEKAVVSEVKAEKLEVKALEIDSKKLKKEEVTQPTEAAEISEIKLEKIEEKKVETEPKKAKEETVKKLEQKAKVSEITAEKAEENRMEVDSKKFKEEEIKQPKGTAEISEVKPQKIEEKKLDVESKKAQEVAAKKLEEKANSSEAKAEKIEKNKVETEPKKTKEESTNKTEEKAEVTEVIAEKLEVKQIEIDNIKIRKVEVKQPKETGEISEIKLEKIEANPKEEAANKLKPKVEVSEKVSEEIEEKQIKTELKKIDGEATKISEEKGKLAEVKADRAEQKQMAIESMKPKDEDFKQHNEERAGVSEVKLERLEEKKIDAVVKKGKEEDYRKPKEEAELSEVPLEKLKDNKTENKPKKTKIETAKTLEETSKVKSENVEVKQMESGPKEAQEETSRKPIGKAKISEAEAENREKKESEVDYKIIKDEEVQQPKETAKICETKLEKLEEKEIKINIKQIKVEDVEKPKDKAKISEIMPENVEENIPMDTDSKKIKDKQVNASKTRTEIAEIKTEKPTVTKLEVDSQKITKVSVKKTEEKVEISKTTSEEIAEKQIDSKQAKQRISEAQITKSGNIKLEMESKTKGEEMKKPDMEVKKYNDRPEGKQKKPNEYMDLREQRNAKRMPSVDIKLTNRNTAVGSNIKLTCGISGNDLTIRWFKENTVIENSSKYQITLNDGLACLEIKSADLHDAAVYRCVAANRNGEVETSCLVTLYDVPTNKFGTPPIFTRNIRAMGETEGETTATDARGSEEPEVAATQDTLQVPAQKKRKLKSPTPGSLRGRSATPIRGRSQTPFTLYMTRRSATPSTWRSITPFLKREEKEKTPFELGRDLRTLLTCNTAVFDRALVMDISEPIEAQKPIRYITSDMSVIDRAAVMDVSNVEVIYVVEEYEEYEEEEEIIEEVVKPKKKAKGGKRGRAARRSAEKDSSPAVGGDQDGGEGGEGGLSQEEREESVDLDESDEPVKKGKKKAAPKKKDKKEKSPSPKLSLKLEIGGGQKASKKMFEEKQQQPSGPAPRPPPKKSKLALQMEEQARAAAKAAEEEAAKAATKKPVETFEERQKRLKAEKEEREREEAERRAQEEAEAAEEAGEEEDEGEGDEGTEAEDASSRYDESKYDEDSRYGEENEDEEMDEVGELPNDTRRSSNSSEGFTRPDPYDEERWKKIAEEEGEEFMQQMRKYSLAVRKSEKQRDEEWQRLRDQRRLPHFVVFLSDRTVEAGNNVRLACAVGGPELSVKWFKDGRQLERDNTHRIINNNNILALDIINTTILDSGEYSCVIANMNDEVTSSCYVTIYEVFKDEPAPPSFRLIKEYYHLRDDELTIEVHLHGVPRPVVTWWRGAFEIKPNVKFTKLEEAHGVYKLLIYKPNSRDSGIYTCKAINSSGEAQISHTIEVAKNLHYHVRGVFHARNRIQKDIEKTAKKAMEEALKSKEESDKKRAQAAEEVRARAPRASPEPLVPAKQKLRFATQLRDRMALEGTTVKLVATIIGPDPACRWMKDDKWVVYGENVKNHTEGDKAIIELKNVTSESSGVYKCVAKNEHSEIETSCYFKVYSAQAEGDEHEPIFALPLRDVYHASQNDLILDTKVRGNPRPAITWIKDQIPVVLDDRIVQIEHLDGICELIINKPTSNDSGKYTCVAQNKLGSQQTSHSVVVDVHQGSRRSSVLSSAMSDSDTGSKKGTAGGDKAGRPPKPKQKDDESEGTYERRSRLPDVSPKQQLYFTTYLSNRYVAVGSKVKLQAVVSGPNPAMKWTKDEQNVQYGPRLRNMSREGLACLEFLNCQPEDSGNYTLVAQNEYCKITTTCQLHVYSPNVSTDVEPVFVRPLKETYQLTLNELTLETGVRGVPTPQVQWLKDNIEIENSGRFHIFQHSDGICQLVIDCPSEKDSGKYIVRAESTAGKAEIVHHVLFRGREHHIANNIHGVFHADKSLLKPKQAEPEKPKEVAKPEASDAESEEGSKGKRRVRKPKKDDEETSAEASSASAYATDTASETGSLKKREKVIGIHFATAVRDRVVAEGSKVKISCFLEAKEPQVKWFKNDEQIQNSQKIKGRYVEGLCSLEIGSATLEDSGEYKCWARDETGEASTFCRLEVYSDPGTGDVPPTFTRNIKDTYHGKINEVQLDCHVRGLPTPTITWVKDGVKIEPSEKYQQFEHDDGTLELFIMDPTQADSGKYVCQAENREGKAEISHMVTVQPRRRRPISPTRDRPPALPPSEENEEEKEKKRKKKQNDDEEGGGRRREVPPPPDLRKRIYFRNFLSNRTVKEGSNVKWMVSIDGPDPTARWFHNDNPIAFGPKSKLSMQDGIAWLNLIGVTEEDSGEYTLKVKGSENEIASTCTLFVYSAGKEELAPPTFTVGIKDAYHAHENHITLECKVAGNPKPKIYWQKDNTLLPEENNKYKCLELPDSSWQLIIENPERNDTGLYTCYAESDSGQMKISKFLDISDYMKKISERTASKSYENKEELSPKTNKDDTDSIQRQEQKLRLRDAKFKLTVETPMKPMVIASGTKAQLICYVTGLIEDVYWLRGDERVTKDSRHKIYNINGALSLEIHDVRSDDTGEYKCVVRNSRNLTECKCNLTVYDSLAAEIPSSFSSPVTATFDAERCEIILTCKVHGRPGITWIRDDHTISNNRYRAIEEMGGVRKLIIRNPITSDCGSFSCLAETNERVESITKTIKIADLKKLMTAAAVNEINGYSHDNELTARLSDDREELTYKEKGKRVLSTAINESNLVTHRKPLFSTLLHDRTVPENSNVRLMCSVVYDGCTNIEWLKDNKPLPQDNRYQTIFHNGEAMLDIFSAQVGDSGHYTCRASNEYGETLSHSQLRIYKHYEDALQPCTFVQSIRDTYSLNENQLVLDCRVRGKPRPEIQWLKGTDMIIPGDRYIQIDNADGYSKLIVLNPTEKDSGLYACVARNEVAENKITHQVDFKGRERFTLEKTHGFFHRDPNKPHLTTPLGNQTVCGGGTIAISAEFMQTQTPIEVQWFRGRQPLAGQPNVKTFYEHNVYTLAIMNAQPENEGTYTCRAQNAYGRIESNANVDVAVGVPKEERPPLFLSRPDTEMKIAVGDPFSISFRIAGDPKPRLTFMKGTKDITKSDRVSKEVSDDYTRFTVQKAQISDSGTYFVVARNNNGTDRIFVTVEIKTPKKKD